MDCRSVFQRWHLASANQRVALWTVCWYVLSSQDHCHNPPSHIHNVSSPSSTCNTKTEIQSYTHTNENVFLNIRSKALYSDRRIFRFKSSTCGYEENSEMLMWKKIRWSTHTRAIALTLSQISSKSGMSPWSHMILIAAKVGSPLQPKSTTSAPSWGLDEPANTWHWINRHSKCALALNQHKVDENSSRSNEQHTFTDNFSIYVMV